MPHGEHGGLRTRPAPYDLRAAATDHIFGTAASRAAARAELEALNPSRRIVPSATGVLRLVERIDARAPDAVPELIRLIEAVAGLPIARWNT